MKSTLATSISPGTTTLTTAYASGWVSAWAEAGNALYARLLLTYTTGDSTSLQVKLEVEEDGGTTGYTTLRVSEGTASTDEVSVTASGASATDTVSLQIMIPECRRFRVRAKKTGGAGTATLAAKVLTGGAA